MFIYTYKEITYTKKEEEEEERMSLTKHR